MSPLLVIGDWTEWVALDRSKKPTHLFEVIGPRAEEKARAEFALWVLRLLKAQVTHCIRNQQFPAIYEPLSPAWAETKKHKKLEPGFWIASGQLVSTLTVWKERGSLVWTLGWPEHVKDPEDGTLIVTIARALEFGVPEKNIPARPLFTILADRMKKSAYRLFRAFCVEKHPSWLQHLPAA